MVHTFSIQSDSFYLNGKPWKILSGAIHYFRIHPSDWEHSLYNLKALGFNTVETYIPWNIHEPVPGTFMFDGMCNIEHFLELAAACGLYAIVRPSPYICAEWEMGGLPAWLLTKGVRLRSSDPAYLSYVQSYYDELLPRLVPHQLSCGGNILMFQVENEYGSYGEDSSYLTSLANMMHSAGITMPLCTSDGPWDACLESGSLIDSNILPTGNFGSHAHENFAAMRRFFARHNKVFPIMCMEFWDGWFSRWNEDVVTRKVTDFTEDVRETMEEGSINLYMFHGGTNFSCMNGCSARYDSDLPQITSYDYGAPLNEQGNPTQAYFALKTIVHQLFPQQVQQPAKIKTTLEPQRLSYVGSCALADCVRALAQPVKSLYPCSMEELGQQTGYTLYQTTITTYAPQEVLYIIDARDRAIVWIDETYVQTQYQHEIGNDITLSVTPGTHTLSVLIEHMGRVNYGRKLAAYTQRKGLGQGVMLDHHFLQHWTHYSLEFMPVFYWSNPTDVELSGLHPANSNHAEHATSLSATSQLFAHYISPASLSSLSFDAHYNFSMHAHMPALHAFSCDIQTPADTFVDMSSFGKGVLVVNGVNVGRFWSVGPQQTLYVPRGLLKEGSNSFVVFDTEGRGQKTLSLVGQHSMYTQTKGA